MLLVPGQQMARAAPDNREQDRLVLGVDSNRIRKVLVLRFLDQLHAFHELIEPAERLRPVLAQVSSGFFDGVGRTQKLDSLKTPESSQC